MKRHWKNWVMALGLTTIFLASAVPTASAFDGCCGLCDGELCGCVIGDSGLCGCCGCGYMIPARRAQCYNWNGRYAHPEYGRPVALLVPPTANLQTNWGWGVTSSRVSRMDHQVQRNYPGPGPWGGPFLRRPAWPSDTTQFGVYHVRGPW